MAGYAVTISDDMYCTMQFKLVKSIILTTK